MGGLAKAAVILAKLNLLLLALGILLGVTTLILAGLSVRIDNETPALHLWPGSLRTPVVKRAIEDVGVTLEEALPHWVPRTRKQKFTV